MVNIFELFGAMKREIRNKRDDFMTNEQQEKIRRLRLNGAGYTKVANELGMSKETVKSFCRRNGLAGKAEDMSAKQKEEEGVVCRNCGKPLEQIPGKKIRKFCSKQCRETWWKKNPEKIKKRAVYKYICANCGREFEVYGNAHRKYCTHDCYIADRFKKENIIVDNAAQNEKSTKQIQKNNELPCPPNIPQMTDDEFNRELHYQISMSVTKSMLEKGIIDSEMYDLIDSKMLERYQPIIGSLLSPNWKKAEDLKAK